MRTMMGLPSLRAPENGDASEASEAQSNAGKQTLFGIPNAKTEQFSLRRIIGSDEDSAPQTVPDVDDDDDEGDRTFIMPAGHLNFEEDDPLRGTVAGRPVKPQIAAPGRPTVDDSSERGSVSGSAVFAASAKPSGPPRHHGATLMGMSLEELEARRDRDDDAEATREVSIDEMRATAFGVPAVQQDDWAPRAQREEPAPQAPADENTLIDEPTQAWCPAASEPVLEDDSRRKLLAKLRKSIPGSNDTSRGLPAVSPDGTPRAGALELDALRKLKPGRDLEPTPVEFPATPPAGTESAEDDALPGLDIVSRGRRTSSPPQDDAAKSAAPAGAYIFRRGESKRLEQGSADLIAPRNIGDELSDEDFGYAETGVAPANLLAQAGFGDDGEPAAAPVPTLAGARGVGSAFPIPSREHVVTPVGPAPATTREPMRTPIFDGQYPGAFDTHQPPVPAPIAPATQQNPAKPTMSTDAPGDDPTIQLIQSVFAGLSGAITIAVVALVLLQGAPVTTAGTLLAAFAVTLGVATLFAAAPFWSVAVRSTALVAVGVLLSLCAFAFVLSLVPKMFLVLGLSAFVAFMAAAFPTIARKLL